ncbi:MAG: hypothetical protein JNL81_11620 [Hyphomonadaceae bacterium]|nr:hypothetical protein [Hyphomonadaceae bacterium]
MPIDQSPFIQPLAQFRASAFAWAGWLLELVLRFGPFSRSRRMRRFVFHLERRVEAFCFVLAWHCVQPGRAQSVAPARPGFRLVRSSIRLFLKGGGVRAKGADIGMRVRRLLDVLADPDRCVARFCKKIRRGLRKFNLVPTAPPAHALAQSPPLQRAPADSS